MLLMTTSLPNPAIREGKPVLTIKMNVICNQEAARFQERQWSPPIPLPALPAPSIPSPGSALSRRPFWHQGPNTSVPSASFSCPKRSPLFLWAFSSSRPLPFWSDSLCLQWDCNGESRSQGQRFYILQWKCSVGPGAKERGDKHLLFGCKECKSAPSLEGKVAVCVTSPSWCVCPLAQQVHLQWCHLRKTQRLHASVCIRTQKMKHFFIPMH